MSLQIPVGIVMTVAPLQPIYTSVLTPEMEISPTAFTRESALEAMSSGISLLASINPGVGVTLEDMAGLFSWF